MKKASWLVAAVAVLSLGQSGCGAALSDAFVSPAANVELARRHYKVVRHGLEARACAVRVLGIGVGDLSYARAVAALNEKAIAAGMTGEYQLINVVASRNVEFYLLGWRTCTVVAADVAVLLEPIYEIGLVAEPLSDQGGAAAPPVRQPAPPSGEAPAPAPALVPTAAAKACAEGSAESCLGLGKAHATGQGMVQDPSLARERYVDACEKGSAQGCFEAGQLWAKGQGAPPDNTLARQMFDKACELRHAAACAELAILVRDGKGGVADPAKADRLARKACRMGHAAACPAR